MKPECKGRGVVVPVVNLNRCEGKGACAAACPYGVFEIRTIDEADYESLSLIGRLKNTVHGGRVAYTPKAYACEACGLCVRVYPERALKLEAVKR